MDIPEASRRFVPKVHPASREVEPEDPMELCATPVAGDPAIMLRCAVEEYARMGWNAEQILALFQNPFYPALHSLCQSFGERAVRQQISGVLQRVGVFCVQATVKEQPFAPGSKAELVEIRVPKHLGVSKS